MQNGPLAHMELSRGDKQKRTRSRNIIEKELLLQLEKKGLTGPIWIDKVSVYLRYWDIEQDLLLDIKIRGPNIEWFNGGDQSGTKKNDSLVQLPKISKEMRDMLSFMDLKPVNPIVDGGGSDENI